MIFPKPTRKIIYFARGKSVEITWPKTADESELEPKKGHRYTLQSEAGKAGESIIEVEKVIEDGAGGWRVVVRLAEEMRPLRIKAKRVLDDDTVETEPEQVDSAFQRRLSEEAHMKNQRRNHFSKKVMRAEMDLVAERRKGKPGKIAEGRLERARKAAEEA